MNMESLMSSYNKRLGKELRLCETAKNPTDKKIWLCNDYGSRSCLTCKANTCWVKRKNKGY